MREILKTKKPLIMGILNVTPDSFSDGGKYFQVEDAIKHAEELIKNGIDIVDIGGESTRPGAITVSEEEELRRVLPIIVACRDIADNIHTTKILISIDTYKSNVARKSIEAGANIINDVSGLTKDLNMIHVAKELDCSLVIMHNKGIPATKPDNRQQTINIVNEVYNWLNKQTQYAIDNGVDSNNIIIDPGIGFGKTREEDMELVENLTVFKSLGFPILVGTSRKSFIKELFGKEIFEGKNKEIIELCAKNGADIIRVHLC